MKLKTIISLLMLASLFLVTVDEAQAQRDLRKFELEELAVDTATDAETIVFAYNSYAADRYNLSWQFDASNISGTTAGTATLQISNDKEGDGVWSDYASFTFSAAADTTFIVNDFPAARARLSVTTTGTQSSPLKNWVRWVRLE